jgi:hypothetical protein
MAKQIWKFKLQVTDKQTIQMPVGAQILSALVQYRTLCIWALVNTEAEMEARAFEIFGTGNPVPDHVDIDHNYKFIATFQMFAGGFVGHLFEPYK